MIRPAPGGCGKVHGYIPHHFSLGRTLQFHMSHHDTAAQQRSNPCLAPIAAEKLSPSSASTINCQTEIRIPVLPELHRSQTTRWSPCMGVGEGLCTQLTSLVTCAACNARCTVFRLLSKERVDTSRSSNPQFVAVLCQCARALGRRRSPTTPTALLLIPS